MKLLVVGGAGYVGRVVRAALESEHECTYYDLRRVEGTDCPTIVADANDDDAVRNAVAGMEGVLYMPLGVSDGERRSCEAIDPAFDVNVKGLYRFLSYGLAAGVAWFCYVSTLSVYHGLWRNLGRPLREADPPNALHPYGMSKRVGEFICQAHAEAHPNATILAIRLCAPADDESWARSRTDGAPDSSKPGRLLLGPESNRRLFAAALRCRLPGYHVVQATGDTTGRHFALDEARRVLNWEPIEA